MMIYFNLSAIISVVILFITSGYGIYNMIKNLYDFIEKYL